MLTFPEDSYLTYLLIEKEILFVLCERRRKICTVTSTQRILYFWFKELFNLSEVGASALQQAAVPLLAVAVIRQHAHVAMFPSVSTI